MRVTKSKLSGKSLRSYCVPDEYEDYTYQCVDCGVTVLFTAVEQKKWHEEDKAYIWNRRVRCTKHYKIWLQTKNAKKEMDRLIQENRNGSSNHFDCSVAILEFHKLTGKGNLQNATHLIRQCKSSRQVKYISEQIKNALQATQQGVHENRGH